MNATTRHNLTGAAFTAFGVSLTALCAVPAVAAAWYGHFGTAAVLGALALIPAWFTVHVVREWRAY